MEFNTGSDFFDDAMFGTTPEVWTQSSTASRDEEEQTETTFNSPFLAYHAGSSQNSELLSNLSTESYLDLHFSALATALDLGETDLMLQTTASISTAGTGSAL
jgi:hypothetical protein